MKYRASLLIGLCCLFVYNANLRPISAGDNYPARYLPFAILQHHTLYLDSAANVAAQGRGRTAFWLLHRPHGRVMSLYPIVTPVLITPLYVPAVVFLHARGWTDVRLDRLARIMEKLCASLIAALSASLLYLVLRRRATPSIALLLTIAYAFGTTTWMISSQALWQHGMAQLLIVGALLVLTGSCTAPRAIAAGLLVGLAAGNRPPDTILAIALGIYGLFWARRRWPLLAASAAMPMLLVLLYNLVTTGNVAGGYGLAGRPQFLQHDLLPGLAGLLVSPTRGLLVFSPFFVFLVLAWRYRPVDRDERRLTLAMAIGAALQILLYAKADWRAGLSWGPRYLTDLLPFFIWMLVPVVTALRGFARLAFHLAAVASIAFEAMGAFSYMSVYDAPIFAADHGGTNDMHAAWNWRNSPLLALHLQGLAPPDLIASIGGNFEDVANGTATGWALANRRAPAKVAVIVDGEQTFSSSTFSDRGWRVPLDASHLKPGEHTAAAFVWPYAKGEGCYLGERKFMVETIPTTLEESAQRAISRIRQHQQSDGSWLTTFTSSTRYERPGKEMNTFLTSLLVDLLDPIAALDQNLQRARRHLTQQIEPDGLVRYHGLPNGPGIGTLGCVITPDTDDTALVWRIAPAADRARLTNALSIIDRYRTSDGLYRSWLAPRDRYQCLDPGRDPNPTDAAIQMHLLMLLAAVRPDEARALCDALRRNIDDDRVWVYYRDTPLVPILRIDDLRRAGCDLQLPAKRTSSRVAEQQIWFSAVRALGENANNSRDGMERVEALLRELARDDFAPLRANPPLLYHNDLTATVSRYYWSEDAGYALWLRLYDEYERHGRR